VSFEPERPSGFREEWMAMLFVGIIVLACAGAGIMLLLGS
jgi:hypothetical protein